jgi:SWI/SNF related-matrix-associated actin-dependent regulator of chromatin subfamily C
MRNLNKTENSPGRSPKRQKQNDGTINDIKNDGTINDMEIDLPIDSLQAAAASAFGSAACKAHSLSLHFENILQTTIRILLESQLSKLSLKLTHFNEMEKLLDSEIRHVEAERIRLYSERICMKSGTRGQMVVNAVLLKDDEKVVDDCNVLVLLQQ